MTTLRTSITVAIFTVSTLCFGQGSAVKIENKATNEETNRSIILQEIDVKRNQLKKEIASAGFRYIYPNSICYDIDGCEKEIAKIQKRKQLINKINYVAKATELDNLYKQIGIEGGFVENYHTALHKYDRSELLLNEKIDEINGKVTEKIVKAKSDRRKDLDIANEIVEVANMTDLSTNLSKTVSLNDFLAENVVNLKPSTTEDFLSDYNTYSDDEDFLEEASIKEKDSFKIYIKNGKMGVEDVNGNILIPYKFERILEYQDGVAKVSSVLERITLDKGGYGVCNSVPTSVYVSEVGFVNSTGEYILPPKKEIDISYSFGGGCLEVILEGDNRTSEERKADSNRANKREELFFERQIIIAQNKLIKKHNIK